MRCGEGVSPSPLTERSGEGAKLPPYKYFSHLDLQMATFGAFWGQVCVFHLQTPESDSLD